MADELSAGKKAARTKKRRIAATKAVQTKRRMSAFAKARAAEAASKEALRVYCQEHGWKIAFFEGATGSPRTGIIDAVAFRLGRKNADALNIRLIQLKGGNAGVSGSEIARLKKATSATIAKWLIAAYDGETLHVVPDDPEL
jgi:DNA invertase Pin-like site-specific DNA recombinase